MDDVTALTQESEALLADVYGTQMSLTVYPSRLRAIEQAAARRALEGSGVNSENGGRETGLPTALDMLREAMEAEWPDGAATADVLAEKYGPMKMSPETTRQLLRDLLALARADIAIDPSWDTPAAGDVTRYPVKS